MHPTVSRGSRLTMFPWVPLSLALLLIGGAQIVHPAHAGGSKKEPEPVRRITNTRWVSESNTAFALDLYSQLAKSEGNLFLSPYSISSALAMTLAGARGATASEMERVLHLGRDDVHEAFQDLREELAASSDSGPELSIANRIWGEQGFSWEKAFLERCRDRYDAALGEVDFANDPEGARSTINGWCAEQTHDRIQNLLAQGTVDRMTRLVLTNAIYFKGTWDHPFTKERTEDGPFFLTGGSEVPVPLMKNTRSYGYSETAEIQALEMPYTGGALSMVVLLPKQKDGLAEFERGLHPAKLAEILGGLHERSVKVTFPRFGMTSQFSLASILEEMGMETAFGRQADFSGMCREPLAIGAVVHKAFVEVNEEGTEAAAATAVTMRATTSVPMTPPEFVADHPFLFLIRDIGTGSLLFLGRMADPRG